MDWKTIVPVFRYREGHPLIGVGVGVGVEVKGVQALSVDLIASTTWSEVKKTRLKARQVISRFRKFTGHFFIKSQLKVNKGEGEKLKLRVMPPSREVDVFRTVMARTN